jgi:RNA 2',3'-cyclic 3'-phosphodiesterase
MLRKIFIAVDLDDKNKKHIHKTISRISFLEDAIRKVDFENYHLTLCFLGNVDDEDLGNICLDLKNNLVDLDIFDLNFNKLEWGPKPENPKMLWLTGEKSDSLTNLRFQIEKVLSGSNVTIEKKDFLPHINLGRMISKFKKENKELPQLEQEINILVPVVSVDVMESVEEKGKRGYQLLESIELG